APATDSLPLHDALPISSRLTLSNSRITLVRPSGSARVRPPPAATRVPLSTWRAPPEVCSTATRWPIADCSTLPASPGGDRKRWRSEEHTSELQSRENLV